MKRKLFVLPLLALMAGGTLASCGKEESEPGQKDEPYVPCSHVDANHDGKCDKCGQGGLAIKHTDKNGDYKCDVCGAIMDHTHVDEEEDGFCDICGAEVPIPVKEPETFAGYKRVLVPEDGKQYLIGMYQPGTFKMIFMNGSPHRDQGIDYPFYFGCNEFLYTGRAENKEKENDVDIETGAVKVQVDYVNDTEFTIKFVDGTGAEDPQYYKGYLQVYGDYNSGTKTSIKFDESLEATYGAWTDDDMKTEATCTEHSDHNEDGICDVCHAIIAAEPHTCVDEAEKDGKCDICGKTVVEYAKCSNKFRIIKEHTYNGKTKEVNAIVTDFANQCSDTYKDKSQPVALGTWGMYNNVEALTSDKILDSYMTHFWEKIETPAE